MRSGGRNVNIDWVPAVYFHRLGAFHTVNTSGTSWTGIGPMFTCRNSDSESVHSLLFLTVSGWSRDLNKGPFVSKVCHSLALCTWGQAGKMHEHNWPDIDKRGKKHTQELKGDVGGAYWPLSGMEGTVRGTLTLAQFPCCAECGPTVARSFKFSREARIYTENLYRCYNASCYIQIRKPTLYASTVGQTKGAACHPRATPGCSEQWQLTPGTAVGVALEGREREY